MKQFYLSIALAAFVVIWFGIMRRGPIAPERPVVRTEPVELAAELPQPVRELIESKCIDCHDSASRKGGLDFEALPAQLAAAPVEAKWTLVFDRVQRGEMPPKKKSQPSEGERAAFMESLGGLLSQHDTARRAETGRVAWRRLNRHEYENTVRELLAIDTPLVDLLPEDGSAHGFDSVSEGLRLSAAQIEAYLVAADTALSAAINLKPRPALIKQRVAFLESPSMRQNLAVAHGSLRKDGTKNEQMFRALPDAVVMFVNQAHRATLFGQRTEEAGLYRVRLSAYAFQNKDGPTVAAKLMATDLGNYRLVAAFDLPTDQPRVVEAVVRLGEREFFTVAAAGCGVALDGSDAKEVGGNSFTGSGLALQWAEMEGPLLETWPPVSVQRVFGALPIKPLTDPDRPDRGYEVAGNDPAEMDKTIAAFAQRAFRRPVRDDEVAHYAQLAHRALAEGAGMENAVRRACKAILTSPEFLFLRETPGRLDDYALAARLSYFLWSTMPDEELRQLAAQGKLHEPATLRAQTERLLASPKAQAFVRNFCGQWLNIRAINATMPDKRLYPEFDDLLQLAMVSETESFFEEVLRSNLGVPALIESDFAMLNRRLAEHYGITGVSGEEFRKVTLPVGSRRGGLLTQASVLKVTANGTLSSPVLRGVWVMKRILGREPQPPPADAGAIEPDTRGSTTIREQLAKHRRVESCNGCHQYIDPAGFALESYDVIGGWRESYRTRKGKAVFDPLTRRKLKYGLGLPVDPSGELADGRKFTDIDGLKKLLLDQQEMVARNLVNNLVAYGTGAGVTFSDRARVEEILQQTKSGSYPVRDLVHEVVQSPLFQTK